MKTIKIIGIVLFVLIVCRSTAQPPALQEFSRKMKTLKTFSVHFIYAVQNSDISKNTNQAGDLLISGKKYRLDWGNTLILFDGKVRYTYLKSENEITLEYPNIVRDGIFSDPSAVFSIDYNDFSIKQIPAASEKDIIALDLIPKQKELPYQKITMALAKTSYMPMKITYYGSDGRTTALIIDKFDTNTKSTDADFVFNVNQCCPDAEIIDMR